MGVWRSQARFYNGRNMKTGFVAAQLVSQIQAWGQELAFSQIGVTGVDLSAAEPGLNAWLQAGFHGDMGYMASHGLKRARPAELVPGTVSVITARMDYLPRNTPIDAPPGWHAIEFDRLQRPGEAIVSVYARGRDYHKVLRARLQKLCDRIAQAVGPLGHRVFTDSAPVLEAELAQRSGQGWRGKHTLLLSREGGSQLYVIGADGEGVRRLTQSQAIDTEAAWAPNGASIYFVSDRGGGPQIYQVPAQGGAARRVTFTGAYNVSPSLSPDGRWLTYVGRVDGGAFRVHLMDLGSGQVKVLTDTRDDERPSFAPNSRLIIYATRQQGRDVLMTTSLDGRIKARLATPAADVREPVWGPYLNR